MKNYENYSETDTFSRKPKDGREFRRENSYQEYKGKEFKKARMKRNRRNTAKGSFSNFFWYELLQI